MILLIDPEINSYWIGLRKLLDEYNQEKWTWSTNSTLYNDVSWWPWRRGSSSSANSDSTNNNNNNNCVVKRKNEDGYFATSCDSSNKNAFICQTSTLEPWSEDDSPSNPVELRLECGQTSDVDERLRRGGGEQANKVRLEMPAKSVVLDVDSSLLPIGINSINNVASTTTTNILPLSSPNRAGGRSSKSSSVSSSSSPSSKLVSKLVVETKAKSSESPVIAVVARPAHAESRLNTS